MRLVARILLVALLAGTLVHVADARRVDADTSDAAERHDEAVSTNPEDYWVPEPGEPPDCKHPMPPPYPFDAFPALQTPPEIRPPLDLRGYAWLARIVAFHGSDLREEITEEPNFAGTLRSIWFPCGTECSSFALLDLATGRIVHTGQYSMGIDHRRDSRLLVLLQHAPILNVPDGFGYTDTYRFKIVEFYVWENDQLILLDRACAGIELY